HVKGISKNALQWILNYHWPGNVRELKNAIERIFLLENPEIIETWHFPGYISRNIVSDDNEKNESLESGEHLEGLFDSRTLADMEKLMIQWALNIEHGNQVRAAKRLDITRDQIRYKMKKHHLLV
ncbi:MAG: helix-turn-helix domain-containing protein, partial [Fidelibacterota bacterium]